MLAENDAGLSKPSEGTGIFKARDQFSKPDKPNAPVVTEITKERAVVTWNSPAKDGGSPITNYVLEMKEVSSSIWKLATKDKITKPEYTVTQLQEGKTYEMRVSAENKAGVGPASDPSQPAKYGESWKINNAQCLYLLHFNFFIR